MNAHAGSHNTWLWHMATANPGERFLYQNALHILVSLYLGLKYSWLHWQAFAAAYVHTLYGQQLYKARLDVLQACPPSIGSTRKPHT